MNNPKIGLIGCGKHTKANIYPSLKLLNKEIATVCTRHIENARAAAKLFHAKNAYDDYQKMLNNENLDVVFIITSGEQHAGIVIDCLKAGSHVFVEKPLAWTANDAREVAKVSKETNKHVMVGFMKRYAPAYLKMKRIISDSANFGETLTMTGMFAVRAFGDNETYLKYGGIHYVDLIRFLFGEVKELHGYKRVNGKNISQVFSFVTEDGKTGNIFFAGLPSWVRQQEEITVTGVNGFVKVVNLTKISHHTYNDPPSDDPRWQSLDIEDRVYTALNNSGSGGMKDLYLNGFVGEIKHFFESIENDKSPDTSAEDNVKTMIFLEKIMDSLIDPK